MDAVPEGEAGARAVGRAASRAALDPASLPAVAHKPSQPLQPLQPLRPLQPNGEASRGGGPRPNGGDCNLGDSLPPPQPLPPLQPLKSVALQGGAMPSLRRRGAAERAPPAGMLQHGVVQLGQQITERSRPRTWRTATPCTSHAVQS